MMKNLAKEGHFAHKYKEGLGVRYHGPHPGNQRRTILADGVITRRTYHSYNHDSWDVSLTVIYNPPRKLNTPLPAKGVSERNMTPLHHHIKAEQFKAKAKAKADAEAKDKADAYAASIQSPQVKPPSPPPESARNASKLTSCCRGKRKAVIAKEGELSELDSDAPAALDILTNETVEAFWEENPSSLVDCRVNIKKRSKKGLITGKATVVSFNRNTRVHKLRFDSGKLLLVPMESTTFEHLVGKDDRLAGKYTIYNNQLPRKEFGSLGISVHNAAKGITEGMKRKRPVVETQPQGASGGVAAKTNARTPHGGYTRTNPSAKAPGKPTGDSTVKSPLQNQPSADHEKSPLHPFGDVLTSFTDIVNDGLSNGYKECENFLGEVAKNVTAEWSGVPNDNLSSSGNFVAAVLQASESVAMKRTSAEAAKAAEEKAKLQAAAEVKAAAAAAAAARAKGEAAAKAKAKKEEAAKVRAEAEARVRAGAAAAQAKAEAAAAQAKAQEKEARAKAVAAAAQAKAKADAAAEAKAKDQAEAKEAAAAAAAAAAEEAETRAKAVAAAAQAKAKADAAAEAKAKDEAKAKEAALAAAAAEEAEASAAFDDRSRFGSDFHQRAASKSAAQKQLFGQLDVGKVVVVSWENGEDFYGEVMDVDQSNRRRPSKGLIGSMATHLIKYETGDSFWQDMWEEQYLVLDSDDSEPPQKKSPPSKSRKKKGAQELDARVPGAFADVDYGSINQQRAEEETEPAFEVKISAKDLQRIKEFTNEYQDLETGGDLFGGWHPDGSCTITAITGPGENAKRTSTTWNQSEEFMVAAGKLLTPKGRYHLGTWHSHHRIKLTNPSPGDSRTCANAIKNYNRQWFIAIVTTIETEYGDKKNPFNTSAKEVVKVRPYRYTKGKGHAFQMGELDPSLTGIEDLHEQLEVIRKDQRTYYEPERSATATSPGTKYAKGQESKDRKSQHSIAAAKAAPQTNVERPWYCEYGSFLTELKGWIQNRENLLYYDKKFKDVRCTVLEGAPDTFMILFKTNDRLQRSFSLRFTPNFERSKRATVFREDKKKEVGELSLELLIPVVSPHGQVRPTTLDVNWVMRTLENHCDTSIYRHG